MDVTTLLEKLGPLGTVLALQAIAIRWAVPRINTWVEKREQSIRDLQTQFLEKLEQKDAELKAVYKSQAEEYRETTKAWIEATTGTTKTQE